MTNSPDEVFEFPCRFPIKVVAREDDEPAQFVLAIVDQHVPREDRLEFSERKSSKGAYRALTIVFTARSRAQLDDLYRALSADERIIMAM